MHPQLFENIRGEPELRVVAHFVLLGRLLWLRRHDETGIVAQVEFFQIRHEMNRFGQRDELVIVQQQLSQFNASSQTFWNRLKLVEARRENFQICEFSDRFGNSSKVELVSIQVQGTNVGQF